MSETRKQIEAAAEILKRALEAAEKTAKRLGLSELPADIKAEIEEKLKGKQ